MTPVCDGETMLLLLFLFYAHNASVTERTAPKWGGPKSTAWLLHLTALNLGHERDGVPKRLDNHPCHAYGHECRGPKPCVSE